MASSDEQLFKAYCAGETAAFDELFSRHSGRVFSYLKKRLDNSEEAQEAFQSVFLKLHQSRSVLSPEYLFSQSLFVITRSVLLDRWRKSGRSLETMYWEGDAIEQVPDLRASMNPDTGDQDSGEGALLSLISQLPVTQGEAVRLRVLDELTYAEIAKKLECAEPGVRKLVSRGLAKLRELAGTRPP